jgi:hypothetical protein
MPTIFFNTAWMRQYKGVTDDDLPRDGGSWEEKHEVCNFLPIGGKCYGFVQPAGETISLDRIGAAAADDHIDGVTVVWSARSPSGHTVVVGFYKNARLYRHRQKLPKSSVHEANRLQSYFAVCREEDAILLSHKRRAYRIPRGTDAMGQSLVWYGDTNTGAEQEQKFTEMIAQLDETRAKTAEESAIAESAGATAGSFDEEQQALEDDVQVILDSNLAASEKSTLIQARVGQGKFRKQVLQMWRNACAVSDCKVDAILRASHIKPWRECINTQERLDPDNGLILAANLDALFDRGLISFENTGSMLIDKRISSADGKKLGLGSSLLIRPNQGQARYLKYHRESHGFS